MNSPKIFLLVLLVGLSTSQVTDEKAIEECHNFFKGFMKAIKSGDLLQVLDKFSPQSGDTAIDVGQLLRDLKNLRVSFRGAYFIGDEIHADVVFRPAKTEAVAMSAQFVLEKNPVNNPVWTIKSMTELQRASP